MDKIKPQSGLGKQNEVLVRANEEWIYFSSPHQIIKAETLEDVLPALQRVENLITANGWYAAGFLSYEAASAFDSALQTKPEDGFPYVWFGLYPEPLAVELPPAETPMQLLDWHSTIDRELYDGTVEKIKGYISQGKTYQVNYTIRLQADFTGDAWDFFLHLAQGQNNHAAYVNTGQYVICSASPELFFELDKNTITSRPMKGTAKRGRTTIEDLEQSRWLQNSEKNRAENVMIVDMIRNDLGKIAKIGSVQAPRLFEVERYSTVWQMTSTVTAKTNASLTEIFEALFPSASITGAPKISTMKIIADLEDTHRKIYTGSIGYISPARKASFNVAIRTLLIDQANQKAEYGMGGGIVWDSSSAEEYAEALLKARVLVQPYSPFSLLETILWDPKNRFFLREKHIGRILDSAKYFDIPITKERLEEYLDQISARFSTPQRVRVLLGRGGELSFESRLFKITEANQALHICLAKEPIDSSNVFLFHKTTQRDVYDNARKGFEVFDDVLLYNESNELTEFTIGNLVVELNDQMVTPPISCGVLAGTFRSYLMETGQIQERIIPIDQLKKCTKIYRINSIRMWQRVEIQEWSEKSKA
jgi:para-aminobenzoate synthetase/4-amino-4-deoxychorismate lyase